MLGTQQQTEQNGKKWETRNLSSPSEDGQASSPLTCSSSLLLKKKNASSPLVWLPSYRIPSENPPALVSSPKLPPKLPSKVPESSSLTACPARRTLLCSIFPQVFNSHLLFNSTTWFSDHQPRDDTWLFESPPPGKTTAENAWKWAPKLGSTPWFTKTNFRIEY